MNILIVGGAGYVGGALTDFFVSNGSDHIRVYDSLVYEESYRKPIEFIYGDIRDHKLLKPQLDWADKVVWLAALVGDGACAINPALTKELNQDSVQWLSNNFHGHIIFLSTCSVYGAQEGELNEGSPTNPLSVYAETKLAAEQYLKNQKATVFRLGTIFGVGDIFSRIRLDLVLNIFTVRAATEGKITVFGGDQYRPILHVRDAAYAIYLALYREIYGVYNLHYKNILIMDLALRVKENFPKAELIITTISPTDARNYSVNSQLGRREFAWKPVSSVGAGIEQIKTLIQTHRIKDVTNPRYCNKDFLTYNIPT